MNINPMMLINMLRSGNPEQNALQFLEQNSNKEPIAGNLANMIRNKDQKGIEQFARNMCKERGIDADNAMKAFMQQFGIKF